MGWALIRGWALINFFCLKDGRLFEVGANSRLGAYSIKYGNISGNRGVPNANFFSWPILVKFCVHLRTSSRQTHLKACHNQNLGRDSF